jgi:hypothetical protein
VEEEMRKISVQNLVVQCLSVGLVLVVTGCVLEETPCKGECPSSNGNPWTSVTQSPKLTAHAISGHLGSPEDCPDNPVNTPDSDSIAPSESCDGPDCGGVTNRCYSAMANVEIRNLGDADATGVQIERIELFGSYDGETFAELPLYEVMLSNGDAFDGLILSEDKESIHVSFQAPVNLSAHLRRSALDADDAPVAGFGGEYVFDLRITFSAENHGDIQVEYHELFSDPNIDT